jgi:hypothetical protein
MRFFPTVISFLARKLNISPLAVEMVGIANSLSGLGKDTLPKELVPLNSLQLSRGLLNFTVIQTLNDWIFPYWARRQYDRSDPSFIPRSHLGLSMNMTNRNWTGIGFPDREEYAIVDPRGLTTVEKNGWSIDIWVKVGDEIIYPSELKTVNQKTVLGAPVVETTFEISDVVVDLTAWMSEEGPVEEIHVRNRLDEPVPVTLGFAVRPFNPEGIGLVKSIGYDPSNSSFSVNGQTAIVFSATPNRVRFGNQKTGDCARYFGNAEVVHDQTFMECEAGLGNAVAEFDLVIEEGRSRELLAKVGRIGTSAAPGTGVSGVVRRWQEVRSQGTTLVCPDERIATVYNHSVMTLLLLSPSGTVTPGPFTYNQFWFRDAALMLLALDRSGFHSRVRPVLEDYPNHQDRSGYFRSQQGEWDSNGQALWSVMQHVRTAGDGSIVESLLDSLRRGADWLDRERRASRAKGDVEGLLPPGLSAEHLGLSDQYFWDDFWGIAGLEAFAKVCGLHGKVRDAENATSMAGTFRHDVAENLKSVRRENRGIITAAPRRRPDAGTIGSIACLYPLQIIAPEDVLPTLAYLSDNHADDGLFYHEFIHSGYNIYLSLQIAHAYLFTGNRDRFWRTVVRSAEMATTTGTWPEAIHPSTGGGVMGDGHHGWAAAEFVLAVRDAFVVERRTPDGEHEWLEFLSGIPAGWFTSGTGCSLVRAPVHGGVADVRVSPAAGGCDISIAVEQRGPDLAGTWKVRLPFAECEVSVMNGTVLAIASQSGTTVIEVQPSAFAAGIRVNAVL